jgi:hypothetical protein
LNGYCWDAAKWVYHIIITIQYCFTFHYTTKQEKKANDSGLYHSSSELYDIGLTISHMQIHSTYYRLEHCISPIHLIFGITVSGAGGSSVHSVN